MHECIVRMERVPKNCDDGCWGRLSGECPWCDSIDGYKMVGNRPPNCPIIAVLPEGHGRLVDADANFLGVIHLDGGCYANYNTTIAKRLGKEDMRMVKVIVPAEAERSET